MNALDVSRWQFGITTVYHFIFVPLTIGLAPLIAVMQTAWVVTRNAAWYRLTKLGVFHCADQFVSFSEK